MTYFEDIKQSMTWLGEQPNVLMVGQGIKFGGVFMAGTLADVPENKKLEFPVAESFQMQFCIGLALAGYVPICIFPRFNFLLLAASDIINTLDKLPLMSDGEVKPRVIIRTAIGPDSPISPSYQHLGNFMYPFVDMCQTIQVVDCAAPWFASPFEAYKNAYEFDGASIVVEDGRLYNS